MAERMKLESEGLSKEEVAFFHEYGYAGPFPFIDESIVNKLTEFLQAKVSYAKLDGPSFKKTGPTPLPTVPNNLTFSSSSANPAPRGVPMAGSKSAHLLIPEIAKIGLMPEIINRIKSLCGNDLILWGSELIERKEGQSHRWHEDMEHVRWGGMTAWVALSGVSEESTLSVISGSHRFGVTPQEVAIKKGIDLLNDGQVLREARTFSEKAEITKIAIRPGEFFIFSRIWHASHNKSGNERSALIFQYAKPSARIEIPVKIDPPSTWLFDQPAVMLASGSDAYAVNHYAPAISPLLPPEKQRLKGETALITGGSRGIGFAIACKCVSEGARIAILATDGKELEIARKAIRFLYGTDASAYRADVTHPQEIDAAASEFEKLCGPIGILVNNAGRFRTLGPLWEADLSQWLSEANTNMIGPLICSRRMIPGMISRKNGTIINIIGGGAGGPIPFGSAYASSKAAFARMTECLELESGPLGVHIFGINPQFVKTRMTMQNAYGELGQRWRPQIRALLEEGAAVSPEYAAELAVLFASGKYAALAGRVISALTPPDMLHDLANTPLGLLRILGE